MRLILTSAFFLKYVENRNFFDYENKSNNPTETINKQSNKEWNDLISSINSISLWAKNKPEIFRTHKYPALLYWELHGLS